MPYLAVLASLHLIDSAVANTALVKTDQFLAMKSSTLALEDSISTLSRLLRIMCPDSLTIR